MSMATSKLMAFVFVLSVAFVMGINGTCSFSSARDGLQTARCLLVTPGDYNEITTIPSLTKELVCDVIGEFNERASNFSHLHYLETLKLQGTKRYLSYQTAFSETAVSTITRGDIFQKLTNLQHLAINLVLDDFNPATLRNLTKLTTLDISYTQLTGTLIRGLMEHLQLYEPLLTTLNMTGVQRVDLRRTPSPIRIRDDIYQYVAKMPLKTLELLENTAIEMQPGLKEFLPDLEVFRVGGNELLTLYQGDQRPLFLECSIMDLLVHTSIREYNFIFPELQRSNRIDLGKRFSMNDSRILELVRGCDLGAGHNTGCKLLSCICNDYVKFECENIKQSRGTVPSECFFGVHIPLPQYLETAVFRNMFVTAMRHDKILCANPSNSLKYLEFSNSVMENTIAETFGLRGLRQLRYLNLQNDGLRLTTDMTNFRDSSALEVMLLGGNRIFLEGLGKNDFLELKHLKSLDMQQCGLETVPFATFDSLLNLEALNLSKNIISDFNVDLTGLHNLTLLNPNENNIAYLDDHVTSALDMLVGTNITLDVSFNPLECSCRNLQFLQWLQSTHVIFARKKFTHCRQHITRQSLSPWEIDTESLYRNCIHFTAILASALSAFGISAAIAVTVVLYKRRWRLRYWLHTARESWRKNHDPEAHHDANNIYKYDAFVAYSTNGEERPWVHTTLRETLEDEYGLKVCIHYRDFKLGRDLADTIVEAIDNSRKILFILSPSFIRSGWCDFELRMAHEKDVKHRRDSLVFVIFSKLNQPGTRMPKSLARLLEKRIYIEWTHDPDGQKLFWRRLVDAIQKERRHDAFQNVSDTAL